MKVTGLNVAMRLDASSGRFFFDLDTFSFDPGQSNTKALENNKQVPEWARDNPIQRIVRVIVEEVKS